MMSARRLIITTGSKGGTGKSFMARYLADKFQSENVPLTLVDADPDVRQLQQYYPEAKTVEPANVAALLSIVEDSDTPAVLMDMPGRGLSDLHAANQEASMFEWLAERRVLTTMINVITPYRASTSSVGMMLDIIGDADVANVVVLNRKFGLHDSDWIVWYGCDSLDVPESKSRQRLIAAGGTEIKVPDVRTSVAVMLDCESETFSKALSPDGVSLRNAHMRQYLRTWLRETDAAFRPIEKLLGL